MRPIFVVPVLAAAALAAALFLFWGSDTGEDVPARVPRRERTDVPAEVLSRHPDAVPARPEMVAKAERRKAPDATFANVSSSAWVAIKRELSTIDVDDELREAINLQVQELRSAYLSPDEHRIASLAERQVALIERVRAIENLPASVPALITRLEEARLEGVPTEEPTE